jgi:hypothetical protein
LPQQLRQKAFLNQKISFVSQQAFHGPLKTAVVAPNFGGSCHVAKMQKR